MPKTKKTPLYDKHMEHGGSMIEFEGWALPLQYSSIISECKSVRNQAGLFDVSHMGEIIVKGKKAQSFVEKLITNSISDMDKGRIVYSPICYPDGGVVDDIMIYIFAHDYYMLVVNASNTEKDYNWIKGSISEDTTKIDIKNVSYEYAQIALQGPKAQIILQKLTGEPLEKIGFLRFGVNINIADVDTVVSRTGYTGEDGFEIYTAPENAIHLWESIIEAGKSDGLVPAGLGARDILRFEASLPLYGHELSEDISPVEAGLSKFVKFNKNSFTGKDILEKQIKEGTERKLAGFEMLDRGIARSGYDVYRDNKKIGFVTTGAYSPTLKKNIGLAMVDKEYSNEGSKIDVIVREKSLKAVVVKLPFYNKKYFTQEVL